MHLDSGASFDYLESALGKFDDGPFFLGQFSLVSWNSEDPNTTCQLGNHPYEMISDIGYFQSVNLIINHGDHQVDAAFVPFLERFLIVFPEVYKHDLTTGRPRLAAYIEVY